MMNMRQKKYKQIALPFLILLPLLACKKDNAVLSPQDLRSPMNLNQTPSTEVKNPNQFKSVFVSRSDGQTLPLLRQYKIDGSWIDVFKMDPDFSALKTPIVEMTRGQISGALYIKFQDLVSVGKNTCRLIQLSDFSEQELYFKKKICIDSSEFLSIGSQPESNSQQTALKRNFVFETQTLGKIVYKGRGLKISNGTTTTVGRLFVREIDGSIHPLSNTEMTMSGILKDDKDDFYGSCGNTHTCKVSISGQTTALAQEMYGTFPVGDSSYITTDLSLMSTTLNPNALLQMPYGPAISPSNALVDIKSPLSDEEKTIALGLTSNGVETEQGTYLFQRSLGYSTLHNGITQVLPSFEHIPFGFPGMVFALDYVKGSSVVMSLMNLDHSKDYRTLLFNPMSKRMDEISELNYILFSVRYISPTKIMFVSREYKPEDTQLQNPIYSLRTFDFESRQITTLEQGPEVAFLRLFAETY